MTDTNGDGYLDQVETTPETYNPNPGSEDAPAGTEGNFQSSTGEVL